MTVNIKRGFNRVYIVLAVLWACYCVILFPRDRRRRFASSTETSLCVLNTERRTPRVLG